MKTPPPTNRDPQHVSQIIPGVIADLAQRVTVEAHQKFREAIAPPIDDDDIDLDVDPVADVILDRIPQRRHKGAVGRLNRILDQLERENTNRRSAP
jgi:hypothetical protein